MRCLTAVALFLAGPSCIVAAAPDKAGLAFFEQNIRPVLIKHCYSCHSVEAGKPKGGLYVDSRAGLMKGGDSGPAIVAGQPADSLLIQALRHDGIAMPPKEKLPDAVVEDFVKWIRLGAPDPRDGRVIATRSTIDLAAGRHFWAFQPIRVTAPPAVKAGDWVRTPIDRYLLAALEARSLRPAMDADRRTLLRRISIDLTGLPPTAEELDAFVIDSASDDEALARVVDRLLASPRFGERWGRHWLDVARYADSNGKDENLTHHHAWRYRNYVIDSYNADKPFNRFLMEQLAGDLLPAATTHRDEALTATGFLAIGPKVLADRDKERRRLDVVDEQIDTIGRAFLGLTLGCARCHDHKFDPIPQTDYYALAGILGSTQTLDGFKLGNPIVSGWVERPLGGSEVEAQLARRAAHLKSITTLGQQIKKTREELKLQEDRATMRVPDKLVGIVVDDEQAQVKGIWKKSTYSRPYVGQGYLSDNREGKGEKSVTFTPDLPKAGEYEVFVSYTPGSNRANNVPVTIRSAQGEHTATLDQTQKPVLDGLFASVGKFRFDTGTKGSVTISTKGTTGFVLVDAVRLVPLGELEKDTEMAMGVPAEVKHKLETVRARLQELEAQEKRLQAELPPLPPMVMAVRDVPQPSDARVNIRGNPHQLGPTVPRGFLSVIDSGRKLTIPNNQSGRAELALWLADPVNPLPARVTVNRIWMHLFGEGIVRTVDNFGTQGERPSHPELLDYLAHRFIEQGWSTKKLIRELVLSRAYRQATAATPATRQADPDNRLFSRAQRRRVEAEVIRDAMLQAAGQLDLTRPSGSPVATLGERVVSNDSKGGLAVDALRCRSVYVPIIRSELPTFLEVFDFADPDVGVGRRDTTTVAPQALFLMNSPFVREQAQATAQDLLTRFGTDERRITELFRRTLSREPTAKESLAIQKYLAVERKTGSDVEAWTAVCQTIFGSTEFRLID